ncbi:hypothetical protein A8990_16618 [Paenibacillus taihuensis]|uniref:DUF4328 domain-containing protein n=1 Tax=Paenibacillus taihuensis TaxID=1156355 RepID=A0A3D9Q0V5_9BACL|nr:hypothetical protein [Paenibacillus taihuensis]REE56281.1 hypothetical protein A8990_16618 [Paenibacillus taihuensis]
MKLRSEVLSNVMRIMLAILVAVAVLDLIGSLIYAFSESFYLDSVHSLFSMISIIKVVLYYTMCIVYLVWIFKVHVDLNQLILKYPRTPGGALAAMLIPFYNFYGLPSTFSRMGAQLEERSYTAAIGRKISTLTVPLIILFLFNYVLGRLMQQTGESFLFVLGSVVSLALSIVYLLLTRYVSQGLHQLANRPAAEHYEESLEQQNVLSH